MSKKVFVSNFAQISSVESLGPKDDSIWVSSKSEAKFFFGTEGHPMDFSPIYLKSGLQIKPLELKLQMVFWQIMT